MNRRSGNVTRTLRREESDRCRKLARLAEAAHRDFLLPLCPKLSGTDSLFGSQLLRKVFDTFSGRVTRHDVVDRNPFSRDFIRERNDFVGDVDRILGGDIDEYIKVYLMQKASGTLGTAVADDDE